MPPQLERGLVRRPEFEKNTKADYVVVGGGPTGLFIACHLDEALGSRGSVLLLNQTHPLGGLADRSLEQFRIFHETEELSQATLETLVFYRDIEKAHKTRALTKFPYVFVVSSEEQLQFYVALAKKNENWGFNPDTKILNPDELQKIYPFIDGKNIVGAVVVNNAGRLHFDTAKEYIVRSAQKTTFATDVAMQEVCVEEEKVVGVKTSSGFVATENVIIAPGGFVLKLPQQIKRANLQGLIDNFTVTPRELFSSKVSGFPPNTELFLIAPNLTIARYETSHDGFGTAMYGWADPYEPGIQEPHVDPKAKRDLEFPAVIYSRLEEIISRYGFNGDRKPLATRVTGRTAGYYVAFKDELPILGQVAGIDGLYLAAGINHYGVMTAYGIARLIVSHALKKQKIPGSFDINRTPSELRKSFVL